MQFVGRESELDLLMREVVLTVETSSGRSLFVSGVPGAGKTTLATELLTRISEVRPEVRIARGRCLESFGVADPYLPFVDALRDLADESTSGFVRRDSMSETLADLAPYWLAVVPVVGNLLSATYSTATKIRGDSRSDIAPSREALFVQYLEVIKQLAGEAPLILFLDDLHWADQSSLALLGHLSRGIARLPVVILCTLRSNELLLEKHPLADLIRELERESLGQRVELGELQGEALGALLAAEFGGDVSEPLERWIANTAGGNPLFASELARLLKQNGAAVEEKGEWHLADDIEHLEVPRSAEAVIEKRIERLEAEDVRLLQYASVEGLDFNSTVLARLLEQDELDVLDQLETIERKHQLVKTTGEMVLPDGDIATMLRFSHALVQTVLYRQVVGKRRILLHRKAAEALEAIFAGKHESPAGKLARHFHEGRVGDAAYRYACMAVDTARRVYAHWEAEEYLKIALQHSPGEEETIMLEERLGDVYDTVGYYEKGLSVYNSAVKKVAQSTAISVRLRRKLIVLEGNAGVSPAPALLQRARALLDEAQAYPTERCQLLMAVSVLPDTGDPMEAALEALAIAENEGDPRLILSALERIAAVLIVFSGGRTQDAFPYLQRAYTIIESLSDPLRAVLYHNLSGIAYAKLGRFDSARQEFERMLELGERIGAPKTIASACDNLGRLLLEQGRYGDAEEFLNRADLIHERRDQVGRVQSLINLGECARLSGKFPLAIDRYRQLTELAREIEHWDSEAVAHAGLGLSLLGAGQLEEAQEQAWSALASVADRERWFPNRDMVELFLARLEVNEGNVDAALERLQHTAEQLEAQDIYLWAHIQLERVELMQAESPDSGLEALADVIARTEELESPALEAKIRRCREMFRDSTAVPAASEATE
jgi:tetratricopeptide (TPR) repeat protein